MTPWTAEADADDSLTGGLGRVNRTFARLAVDHDGETGGRVGADGVAAGICFGPDAGDAGNADVGAGATRAAAYPPRRVEQGRGGIRLGVEGGEVCLGLGLELEGPHSGLGPAALLAQLFRRQPSYRVKDEVVVLVVGEAVGAEMERRQSGRGRHGRVVGAA